MRRFLSLLLLILLFLPAALKVGIVVGYMVDYNIYLENCENRNRPQLKCNGKCHLAEELKQIDDPIEVPDTPKVLNIDPVFFFQESFDTENIPGFQKPPCVSGYVLATLKGITGDVLDPPEFIV